jgi:hypothetical protein
MADVGRALRCCVAEHDWSAPPPGLAAVVAGADLAPLVQRGAYHGVRNLVYLSLRGLPGAEPELLAGLADRHRDTLARHLRALADLAAFAAVMDGAGIPWAVFKGPVLAERHYARPDLRQYRDLDLLVPRAAFPGAVAALRAAGIELLDRNWEVIAAQQRAQLHPVLPHGTVADLHWDLLNLAQVRSAFGVDTAGILARAVRVDVGGLTVATFDPVDTLLHVCLHAGLAGGDRLLWLKDAERVIATTELDWDVLVARAHEWGAGPVVATILLRVARLFPGVVPPGTARALAPASLRWAARAADAVSPPERSRGPRSLGAIWTKSVRGTLWASLGELADKVRRGEGLRPTLAQWRSRTPVEAVDGRDPLGALHPTGDDGTRARYLGDVQKN